MVRCQRLTCSRAALIALLVLVAGCDRDADPVVTERGFTVAMTERFAATEDQARCITDYVFADYDPPEIEVLATEGMGALPQARWEPYLNASVACITHDQPLGGGG